MRPRAGGSTAVETARSRPRTLYLGMERLLGVRRASGDLNRVFIKRKRVNGRVGERGKKQSPNIVNLHCGEWV